MGELTKYLFLFGWNVESRSIHYDYTCNSMFNVPGRKKQLKAIRAQKATIQFLETPNDAWCPCKSPSSLKSIHFLFNEQSLEIFACGALFNGFMNVS